MDIRSFKLQTGQELVAELVRVTSPGYEVRCPLVLHAMNTPEGPMLGFVQWSLVAKEGATFEILDVALCAKPFPVEDDIAKSYIEQRSGLVLPPTTSQLLRG